MTRRAAVLPLAAAALLLIGGCSPRPAARRNVVLITIDTLRADRIGRGVAPALDRFAASSVRFTNARTTVPLTLPAHTSIMTGTLPPVHGVRTNGAVVPDALPTLATVLHGAGFRTGAFVGAYVLDHRFGLARGFDTYDDRISRDPLAEARLEADRPAAEVVDAALAWLNSDARAPGVPFFLWVHLYDPHAPYEPPSSYRAPARHPYDGEVAYAGAEAGRLLDRLDTLGLASSTVVAVAGDHGEGLGDHGEQTHGMLAYDATLRVPLMIRSPGESPRATDAPVSLADLAPSLLRLTGAAGELAPQASASDLFGAAVPSRDVYGESEYPRSAGWHPLGVLADAGWKLVVSSEPELFDVRADPGETTNLAGSRRQMVQAMTGRLRTVQAAAPVAAPSPALSEGAAAKLRALGYVGGAGSSGAIDPAAANPGTVMAEWSRFERALSTLSGGDAPAAVADLRDLAARFPAGLVFQSTLARALQGSGQPREAVRILRAAVGRWPSDSVLFHDLAVAARAAGDPSEALRAEQAALALDAANPAAQNGLGLLHADAGRAAEAAQAFERAANADASNGSYWSNLGNARRALGDVPAAEAAYRKALAAQPAHADACNGLGVLLVQRGQAKEAVTWFERALATTPDLHEARLNLGIAYQQSGARDRAMATYRDVLRLAPPTAARERAAATALLAELR